MNYFSTSAALPKDAICYSFHQFNKKTAVGFTKRHSTKSGTWGSLKILKGEIDLIFLDSTDCELHKVRLGSDQSALIIPPSVFHRIDPVTDDFSMELKFYCKVESYFSKKYNYKDPHCDVLTFAKEYLSHQGDGLRVLDVGCGKGRNSLYFGKLGYEVLSVDRNDDSLAFVKQLAEKDELSHLNVKNIDMNAFDDHSVGCYDVVLATVSLQFLDPSKVPGLIKHLQSITNIGGYHHLIFPIQEDPFQFPEHFSYLAEKNELYHVYQDAGWSIPDYSESIGKLSRRGKDGMPIQGLFGTLTAQKVC